MNYVLLVITITTIIVSTYLYFKSRPLHLLEKIILTKEWRQTYLIAQKHWDVFEKRGYKKIVTDAIKENVAETITQYLIDYKNSHNEKKSIVSFLNLLHAIGASLNGPESLKMALLESSMEILQKDEMRFILSSRARCEVWDRSDEEKIKMIKSFMFEKNGKVYSLGHIFDAPYLDREMLVIFETIFKFDQKENTRNSFSVAQRKAIQTAAGVKPDYFHDFEESIVDRVRSYFNQNSVLTT